MSTFIAAYATECPACPALIEPGDEAVYVGRDVEHARCPVVAAPQPVCPSCFLAHASAQKECK